MRRLLFLLLFFLVSDTLHARLPDLIPYRKGNLWGYCDSTKKIIIEPRWESAAVFVCGKAIVVDSGMSGIINQKGEYLLRPKYTALSPCGCNRYEAYIDKKHCGLIDDTGRVIIPFIARWMIHESDSVITANVKGDNWVYDTNGKLILPVAFRGWDMGVGGEAGRGGCAKFGLFIVQPLKKEEFIVVDRNNRQFIPGQYDWIYFRSDSLFECRVGDSLAYYNLGGEFIPDYWPPLPNRKHEPFVYYDPIEKELIRVVKQVNIKDAFYEQVFVGYQDRYGTQYWEN